MGVALFEYNGIKQGEYFATIIDGPYTKKYVNSYNAKIDGKKFILYIPISTQKFISGDKIKITAMYNEPQKQRNYGGFDYSLYLKTKKIYGSFKVTNCELVSHSKGFKIQLVREYIQNILKKNLDTENANLATGFLIGDTSELSKDIQDNFRNASLTHMLAVSGDHFAYIILAVTFALRKLKNKRLGQVITIVIILFFMDLTGNTASVVRAGIMSLIMVLSSILHRRADVFTSMALSLLIQIFINPYVIFDMGTLLSYGGVIGIVSFYNLIQKIIKIKALSVTLSANIVIIPIMMYNFNTISFTFAISNLLAGSLVGIIIILGFICVITKFTPLFFILNILLNIIKKIAEICAKMPLSNVYVITPNIITIILIYILIFIVSKKYNKIIENSKDIEENIKENDNSNSKNVKQKEIKLNLHSKLKNDKKRLISKIEENKLIFEDSQVKKFFDKLKKIIIPILIFIIIVTSIPINYSRNLIINFVDVGQGDCTLIRNEGKSILIDSGGSLDDSFDVGKATLLPYLLDRKITKIDYIFISHFDSDHCQGFIYVLENMNVGNIIIGKQFETYDNYKKISNIANKKKVKIREVEAGTIIKITKDMYFQVLWPSSENKISENAINNNSMVCKLVYKNFSMLFTGDIEEIAEKAILEKYKYNLDILNSTVLKVAHHGSKTSSIKELLGVINPKYAVIGVGKDNKFGHPSEGTLINLKSINSKIFRTDEMGEISIEINNYNSKIRIKRIICKSL